MRAKRSRQLFWSLAGIKSLISTSSIISESAIQVGGIPRRKHALTGSLPTSVSLVCAAFIATDQSLDSCVDWYVPVDIAQMLWAY